MNNKERIARLEGRIRGHDLSMRSELKSIEKMIEQAKSLVESLEERKESLQKSVQILTEGE